MNKRQKKKYDKRVLALVTDATYESTGHKDIFTPLFDDDPVILPDRTYSISLSVTPSGARMASVRTWRKWL